MRLASVIVIAFANTCLLAGCGSNTYTCQPICTYQDGSVGAGNGSFDVHEADLPDAIKACEADGNHASPPVCDPGGTVTNCSCDKI